MTWLDWNSDQYWKQEPKELIQQRYKEAQYNIKVEKKGWNYYHCVIEKIDVGVSEMNSNILQQVQDRETVENIVAVIRSVHGMFIYIFIFEIVFICSLLC